MKALNQQHNTTPNRNMTMLANGEILPRQMPRYCPTKTSEVHVHCAYCSQCQALRILLADLGRCLACQGEMIL